MSNKYKKYDKIADNNSNWQMECMEKIKKQHNVILSSPTGSGKTRVYLEWAKNMKCKPVIITAPIKALSNQRYRELLEEGYVVGLETGDIKDVPENCDFICCTQEIYTNKYADLKEATLIIDEFHFIFENQNRARTYIDALHKSQANNILLCSATLGDIDKLSNYVEKVSGRKFFTYKNDSRLTSLHFNGDIKEEDINNSLVVTFSQKNIENIISQLILYRDQQSEEQIKKIKELYTENDISNYKLFRNAKYGIAGYYGSLLPKEKIFIEKIFEQGLIDTVIGTDALALGVNFPVENVVFAQLSKYFEGPISKNLFEQLAGRAGRKGYFDDGYVYYCSDLNYIVNNEYNIAYLYEQILKKPNENVSIMLTANIKDILTGKTTIEEEVKYISKFSTEEHDVKKLKENISNTINYIINKGFEEQVNRIVNENFRERDYDYYEDEEDYYDAEYKKKYETEEESNREEIEKYLMKQEFLGKYVEYIKNIDRVYFDEYSVETNCEIFVDILCGVDTDEIINKYASPNNFNNMLQFRKYVKSLPSKYRKGLTKINDIIRKYDKTAIDGFRGCISTEEITKQLEEEGKLERKNVMKAIQRQPNEKMKKRSEKMKERSEIIDKQIEIAKEYELEEY